jgi:hypothetical protein
MESLNIMDDIKREWEILSTTTEVVVTVRVSWVNGICLPDNDGNEVKSARFKMMTLEDNEIMSRLSMRQNVEDRAIDSEEMRKLMIRRLLLGWDLDIPIERYDNWLTKECFERVMRIPAPLLTAILLEYEKKIVINDEEENEIRRQSIVLFSPNSGGIQDACEAVTLFCNYGNFWEKFGLNKWDMKGLTYREYLLLRLMIGHDMERTKKQMKQPSPKSRAKIAGKSGARASRGIVVPNSG